MPPAPLKQLKIGDAVSVQIRCFGDQYAKDKAGDRWNHEDERDHGLVTARDGSRWCVDFQDGEAVKPWKRSMLRFELRATDRPGGRRASALTHDDSSSDDEQAAAAVRAEAPQEDDADSDDDDPLDMPELVPASHGDNLGPATTVLKLRGAGFETTTTPSTSEHITATRAERHTAADLA